MKTKLTLVLMLVGLAGCQQQSEIDKCVKAQLIEECNRVNDPMTKGKEKYKAMEVSESECILQIKKVMEGTYRQQCLRAQAGKE